MALDIQTKFKNVVAITFCRFVGIIVGVEKKEDKKTRTYDLEEFDVVLIDEIYNLTTSNLWDLNNIMKDNKDKIFIAAGDNLQNPPIENFINDDTIFSKIIERLFPNRLQLHRSRRIKDKEQENQLRELKEFIFSKFDSISREELINTLQKDFNIKVNGQLI